MDRQKFPSDDLSSGETTHLEQQDMATAAVSHLPSPFLSSPQSSNMPPAQHQKRYRPAPAKTFQCRGYGECRMVFSRSEHLARHIRKHTGERPFTCHCGKQFSRLDNLRQHAQTVHADKQEQNERMMQELTSIHASMTMGSKGPTRGKRPQQVAPPTAGANTSTTDNGSTSIKQEETMLPMGIRPGTSTGYESGNGAIYTGAWQSDVDRVTNHSFRDPGQSFRVPPASSTATAALNHSQHPGQSFLAPASNPFTFSLPDIGGGSSRPGTGHARPSTATATSDRTLPPLASVVSTSFSSLSQHPHPPIFVPLQSERTPLTSSHVLPLPTPSAAPYAYHGRRPSTAARPGTAPASFFYGTPSGGGYSSSGSAIHLASSRPELSLSLAATTGFGRWHGGSEHPPSLQHRGHRDDGGDESTSPAGGNYDSPFSFHAPSSSAAQAFASDGTPSSLSNPRKRPYSGSDDDDGPRERDVRPVSSSGTLRPATGYAEYDYGTDSRPQSRRLSVMELCNDNADPSRTLIPISASTSFGASRPTTSSGIIAGASQLALNDRTPSPRVVPGHAPSSYLGGVSVRNGTEEAAGGTAAAVAFQEGTRSPEFRGASALPFTTSSLHELGRRYSQSPRGSPVLSLTSSSSPGAGGVRWGPTSPRRGPGSTGVGHGWASVPSPGNADGGVSPGGRSVRSVGSGSGGGQSPGDGQVRVPAVVGMRV